MAAEAINFEWPTQEIADQWQNDVSLKSITFSTFSERDIVVSSVQCTLSTDEESPLFNTEGKDQCRAKIINFDAKKPVRSVQVYSNDHSFVCRVMFLDKEGGLID